MKNLFLAASLLSVIFLSTGCEANFSKGIKTDLVSGLTATKDGLTYEEITLEIDGQKLTGNKANLGDDVKMIFTGVDYFTKENEMVFPGASMAVVDNKGKTIFEEKDLFSEYTEKGVSAELAKDLNVTLTVGDPLQAGQKYLWKVKIWDKKGQGTINVNQEIIVQK